MKLFFFILGYVIIIIIIVIVVIIKGKEGQPVKPQSIGQHIPQVESQFKVIDIACLEADFVHLVVEVGKILSQPSEENDSEICKSYCTLLSSSNKSVSSVEEIAKIKECHNFTELFIVVSPRMSWNEHYILTHIVFLCNSDQGKQEIDKFEDKVALVQGLEIILSTLPHDDWSKDIARFCNIICQPYKSITTGDYNEVKHYILCNLDFHAYGTYGFIRRLYINRCIRM